MPTVDVNGTELFYHEAGTGPSILLVHGMCGSADVWNDQLARLSPHFHCVAYDRRGHTRSPLGNLEQRTVEVHADDAAALIQALRLDPCLIVGSSGGARIVIDVVRRYPRLLRGAVLSEPPLFALDPASTPVFLRDVKPRIEEAVATGGPRAAVDAFFDVVCPGLWSGLDDSHRNPYRDNHRELFGDLQMPPYQITLADLRAIQTPCLIIRGARSHPVLRHIAELLAEGIPGAESLEFAECGHVTYFEQPEAFARSVIEFANRHLE